MSPAPARSAGGGALARAFAEIPVTMWLIVANVAWYSITAVQSRSILGNQQAPLFVDTTLWPPLVTYRHEWWRVLTSAFDHFGIVHVTLNMYMLWLLGVGIERALGHWRYLAVYLVSALGASAFVLVFAQNANTAGASGAIFGLMGAYAVVALVMKVDAKGILLLIGLNVVMSFMVSGISIQAHLGGLVVGVLAGLATVWLPRQLAPRGPQSRFEAISWTGYAVLLVVTCLGVWAAAQTVALPGT